MPRTPNSRKLLKGGDRRSTDATNPVAPLLFHRAGAAAQRDRAPWDSDTSVCMRVRSRKLLKSIKVET